MIQGWPPELLTLEMCDGSWQSWKELLWGGFKRQFVDDKPNLFGKVVTTTREPEYDGKGYTFWHCVSRGPEEDQREIIPARAERILFPRAMIERCRETRPDPADEVVWWMTKRQGGVRVLVSFPDFSHLVVLAKRNESYVLVTQYPIERIREQEKLRQQWEEFWENHP